MSKSNQVKSNNASFVFIYVNQINRSLLSFKYCFYEMKFYVFNISSDKVSVNYSLPLNLLNTEHKPLVLQ